MMLTHYYYKSDRPFQSLSSLSEVEALNIIESLQARTGAVHQRFGNPAQYLRDRRATESWLRAEFIAKGGQPQTLYPQYLTIGRSAWIEDGFEWQTDPVRRYDLFIEAQVWGTIA
jgi:hypothetical protein